MNLRIHFERRFTVCLLFAAFLSVHAYSADVVRIAVGSCAHQDDPQPIWDAIVKQKPDLFLFIGDTIYANTNSPEEYKREFAKLEAVEGFQKLRQTCPIHAIWDDHDFGVDDGGAEHTAKREFQKIFQDFFRVPNDSPFRQQEGVQQSLVIGEPGRRVQIVMLDTRYHRGPLKSIRLRDRTLYLPNVDPTVTMLGDKQWSWFERQLADVTAEVRIVASSIQIIPDEHPFEKWANLPLERDRFLARIRAVEKGTVVLLSGDQHLAEISQIELTPTRMLYELTSSGMTHTRMNIPAPNRHRLGKLYIRKNFGMVEVRWDQETPQISLRIYDDSGEVLHRQEIPNTAER